MNIAFPAFLLLLLILPGFIFRSSFRKAEKTDLDFRPFASQTVVGIFAAILLHSLWVTLARLTPYRIDFPLLLSLLEGQKDDASLGVLKRAEAHPGAVAFYYLSLSIFALVGGSLLQQLVTKYDWDKTGPLSGLLRFNTPWYYLFTGLKSEDREDLDGVYVAAIVVLKDAAYLYQGLLEEYYFDEYGKLERVVLSAVSRRRFGNEYDADLSEKATSESVHAGAGGPEERFYPIEGHYFVLRYSEIMTLNVRYISVQDSQRDSLPS